MQIYYHFLENNVNINNKCYNKLETCFTAIKAVIKKKEEEINTLCYCYSLDKQKKDNCIDIFFIIIIKIYQNVLVAEDTNEIHEIYEFILLLMQRG